MSALRSRRGANTVRAAVRLARTPRDAWLVTRMTLWASLLPLLKRSLGLPSLVALVAAKPQRERCVEREQRIVDLAVRLSRFPRFGTRDNCLERSLILFRFLARANADPRLVVGVRRNSLTEGHAWVVVDDRPVGDDGELIASYEPLVVFDASGRTEDGAESSERAAGLTLD